MLFFAWYIMASFDEMATILGRVEGLVKDATKKADVMKAIKLLQVVASDITAAKKQLRDYATTLGPASKGRKAKTPASRGVGKTRGRGGRVIPARQEEEYEDDGRTELPQENDDRLDDDGGDDQDLYEAPRGRRQLEYAEPSIRSRE